MKNLKGILKQFNPIRLGDIIFNNENGLYMSLTKNNNITLNNITSNSLYGIYVKFATNITIINNNISSNSGGIRVMSTRNIIVGNNSITQNEGTALEILSMMDQTMSTPFKVKLITNLLSSNSNGIFK